VFLDRAMALADRRLLLSPEAEPRLAAVERVLGLKIPPSLRELLASDAWPSFLAEFSNRDRPISLDDLGRRGWKTYDPVEHALLPFMIENQGVCTWAVALNGSDDPEVSVEVDSGDPPTWRHAAPTFSLWLECQVLDKQLLEQAMFSAQAAPIADVDLARLARVFSPGPRTFGWPGRTNHRFAGPLGSMVLWAGDDQCDWWIAPSSAEAAAACLDALPPAMDSEGWLHEIHPDDRDAREALEAWRRARSR
jgi:hypothetical protein